LDDLQEVTQFDRNVITRVLKIMENEGMIRKVGTDKYKEKWRTNLVRGSNSPNNDRACERIWCNA